MKKRFELDKKIKLQGAEVRIDGKKYLDYYVVLSDGKKSFAFQRKYSTSAYRLCKNGIEINRLITIKERNKGIMLLVAHTKRIIPYLKEYCGLDDVA